MSSGWIPAPESDCVFIVLTSSLISFSGDDGSRQREQNQSPLKTESRHSSQMPASRDRHSNQIKDAAWSKDLAWEISGELERGKKGETTWRTCGSAAALPQCDRLHIRLCLPVDLGALPAAVPPLDRCDVQHRYSSGPADSLEVGKGCGICRLCFEEFGKCPPHFGFGVDHRCCQEGWNFGWLVPEIPKTMCVSNSVLSATGALRRPRISHLVYSINITLLLSVQHIH